MNSSPKKTLLYYGGFDLPDKNAAAQRVTANGKLFAEIGYKTIFLGESDSINETNTIHPVAEMDNGYLIKRPSGTKEWIESTLNPKCLFSFADKIEDLYGIFLYNVPLLTCCKVKQYCKRHHLKLIYDCTEWSNYTEGSKIKRLVKKIDSYAIQYFLPSVVKNIIVISTMMQKQYQHSCNCLLLPPLVDLEMSIWHQEPMAHDKFTFCFVGTIGGNKESLDLIIDAYRLVKNDNTLMQIVGVTKDAFISEFGNCDLCGVEFVGRVDHAKAVRYMKSSDCFVFIRKKTRRNNAGFPTKFVETLTCGVPIMTTEISDVADYCNKGSVVLIDKAEAKAIADKMKSVNREEHKLNDAFDYRRYILMTEKWLDNLR